MNKKGQLAYVMLCGMILNCKGDFFTISLTECSNDHFQVYFNNILALPNLLQFSHPSEFNSIALNNNKETYLF